MIMVSPGAAPPFVVVEGPPPVVDRRLRASRAVVREGGWAVVQGWAAPLGGERLVCSGVISTIDDARRALLAAVSGAGLILGVRADRETRDRFLDDLRRLGPVTYLNRSPSPSELASVLLTAEQRSLLAMLGEGLSMLDAAAALGLPRRTAERRLAAACSALDVDSTTGAILAVVGIDVDPGPHHDRDVGTPRWSRDAGHEGGKAPRGRRGGRR
jgi:hypothetical protein